MREGPNDWWRGGGGGYLKCSDGTFLFLSLEQSIQISFAFQNTILFFSTKYLQVITKKKWTGGEGIQIMYRQDSEDFWFN